MSIQSSKINDTCDFWSQYRQFDNKVLHNSIDLVYQSHLYSTLCEKTTRDLCVLNTNLINQFFIGSVNYNRWHRNYETRSSLLSNDNPQTTEFTTVTTSTTKIPSWKWTSWGCGDKIRWYHWSFNASAKLENNCNHILVGKISSIYEAMLWTLWIALFRKKIIYLKSIRNFSIRI